MSSTISAFEAKNRLGALLDRVEAGEEIVITRHGKPVARLAPANGEADARLYRAKAWLRVAELRTTLTKQGFVATSQEIKDWINEGRR